MARDASYAEYADLRWPMLYRLAALLVGEERAQDVTVRGLARAYLSWTEVREAASPDEHLEELLAQVAIEEAANEEAATGADGDGLDGLPVRQRAALVLRCIALLSDVEIARAVGCRPSEVEVEVSEALGRLRTSLPAMTAELERRSAGVGVPPAPVESLLSRGREERSRRRRRTRTWVVAATAAVVAVLAVTALVRAVDDELHRRSVKPIPATLDQLATGARPRIAYVEGRTLHLGGTSVALPETPDVLVQAARWVYVAYPSGTVERLHAVSLATTTVTTTSAGQVVADPSGRYVAWVEARTGAHRPWVVVRTIGSRGETLRQQDRAFPTGPDPFVLVGIDRNGDLFGSRPSVKDGIWVWRTGLALAAGRPVFDRVLGAGNGVLAHVVAGHLVVDTGGGSFEVGAVHGTDLIYDQEVSGVIVDFADPSARRVAQVDETANGSGRNGAWVLPRTDRPDPPRTRLRVPTHATITALRWEDAGHVLVEVTDPAAPSGALVRCDARTGECELAARFRGPHLVAS